MPMDPMKLMLLKQTTQMDIYEPSLHQEGTIIYYLGRRDEEKLVGMNATEGHGEIRGENAGKTEGKLVTLGPTDADNAAAIRRALPWTAPKCIGLATSVGLGDRLGLATPGHVRAVRDTGLTPILAQQSIRELARTRRTPQEVVDAATWGVLQEGYEAGFGSDADHLQSPEDIDATVAAGFTLFTIDPGAHVNNDADALTGDALAQRFGALDFDALETTPADLSARYYGQAFDLDGGGQVDFTGDTLGRAAVKYGGAIAHTARMYRHLAQAATGAFEVEVSVDETDSPTSPAEHYFFASELKRLGVEWVSLAPRFVGRFEKGVDYIGDLDAFREEFSLHAAVMRTLGPYKISIHSGSDKFSIYPIAAELTGGLVHLKTAGTSYLEALRAMASIDTALFREIYAFARDYYERDKATYHVSAELDKAPSPEGLSDEALPGVLDDFHARQVLHVTFGTVLAGEGARRFREPIYRALETHEEAHYDVLAAHLGRHISPFQPFARS